MPFGTSLLYSWRLNLRVLPFISNGWGVLHSISDGSDHFFSCALLLCCLLDMLTFQWSRFIYNMNGRLLCLLFGLHQAHENADPTEIILLFESLKDYSTPALLQSIHMHSKGAIRPELSCSLDLQRKLSIFPFSLKWRIWMPYWLSVYSRNLLLSASEYSLTLCICSMPTWHSLF
jgi:hypothetical protein